MQEKVNLKYKVTCQSVHIFTILKKNKQTNNKNKREKNSGVIQGPQHLTNRMRKETFTEIRKVLPKIKDTSLLIERIL